MLVRGGLLPAEAVEFPVSRSAQEGTPFVRRKSENRAFGVLAVANTDLATGQACHLDAVAVGEAQGALDPVRTWTRPARAAAGRKPFHISTSLNVTSFTDWSAITEST